MKIIVDYKQNDIPDLKIEDAKYLGDFAIRVFFNDCTERLVDFKPFLTKSIHPSIKEYLDENRFRNFQIIDGNLNWDDYKMIFPIGDLNDGQI
jgi:hypothetical protein